MSFLDTLWLLAESSTSFPNEFSSSSSSSSSSEDEYLHRSKKTRIDNFMDVVANYSDEEFRSHFRLKRCMIPPLVVRVSHLFTENKSGWSKVSAELGVHLLLWYLANKETFREIGDRFGITESCAHKILRSLTHYFTSVSHEFIFWPNQERSRNISLAFETKSGFKKVIGCIDGSHISINKPKHHPEDYLNRKNYYSILIQGTVDNTKKFTNIYVGEPGSIHDARMLRKSILFQEAEANNILQGFCLLGDSAYPSLRWLVPPFKDNGNLTPNQRQFNYRHSSTRIIIEHAFGLLKGRFRRLQHFDNRDLKFINQCIVTASIFHNLCIEGGDTGEDLHYEDAVLPEDDPDGAPPANQTRDQMFLEMFPN